MIGGLRRCAWRWASRGVVVDRTGRKGITGESWVVDGEGWVRDDDGDDVVATETYREELQ